MTGFLCTFGLHRWRRVKVFITTVMSDGQVVRCDESWTGRRCSDCQTRSIRKNRHQRQSAGAAQHAYDWLNEVPPRGQVLSLVKGVKP